MDDYNTSIIVPAVNVTDDREAHSKYWLAVYTRSRSEKKVAKEIAPCCIETYVPMQTIIKQWSDRKKKIESVVIPMIVFAKVAQEKVLDIKKHPLVIKVLAFPGQKEPAHIPDKQISQLKFLLKESDEPVEFVQGEFRIGDQVKVVRGKLAGLEGIVQMTSDNKAFMIIEINLLGGAKVSISTSYLRPA